MKTFELFWKANKSRFKNNRAIKKVMRLGYLLAEQRISDLEIVVHSLEKENSQLKDELKQFRALFTTKQ